MRSAACPDVADVRLATPASWREMIFAFGYKLHSGDEEMDDTAQGSGIQSYLMLETLSLIDRDYFKQFGWKQAAIWAVEEPESSLHSSLEARVADFLAGISTDSSSRLQVIATTHSDLMLQYADEAVFAEKQDGATSFVGQKDKRTVLERAAQTGISRWIHPILASPLDPVVLVEGKSDSMFLQQAVQIIRPAARVNICCLEELEGGKTTGGVDRMLQYVKANVAALRARVLTAPVIVVLDWDSASKKVEFEKYLKECKACEVLTWPDTTFNPHLDETFHGIERHMSDRIIDAAANGFIATRADGTKVIAKKDIDRFKKAVMKGFEQGITETDIEYARSFVEEILKATKI